MAGFDMPIWVTRRQIASAIHIVVQAARLTGGLRKIIKISEVTGIENDIIAMHDLFGFKQTGVDENRNAKGHFYISGIRPHCLERLSAAGVGLPVQMFERQIDEV
jgi:pilus assembly protein CpaF